MATKDDLPEGENDADFDAAYETHRGGIYEVLVAYADEHDLSDGFLAHMVSDVGLSLRMVAYASETDSPSATGLKLDLDRFAKELGDSVREAKKDAAEFVAEAKLARDEQPDGDDADDAK